MRVGIFRTCGIGDAVQMTPLLQQLRADVPEAEILIFVSENAAGVLSENPWGEVRSLPVGWLTRQKGRFGLWEAWKAMAKEGPFDVFLSLEPYRRRSLGIWRLRGAQTGGLCVGRASSRIFGDSYEVDMTQLQHASQNYLDLWKLMSGKEDRGFGYDTRHMMENELLPEGLSEGGYFAFAPGSGNPFLQDEAKRWPLSAWKGLVDWLGARGFVCVILGVNGDWEDGGGVDLCGKLSLREAACVVGRARGFVGNDSGLFHIACGLHTPAVGLFGPTNPSQTGPFRKGNAKVLWSRSLTRSDEMGGLSVEMVGESLLKLSVGSCNGKTFD